jgi:hypothetical protein
MPALLIIRKLEFSSGPLGLKAEWPNLPDRPGKKPDEKQTVQLLPKEEDCCNRATD